MNKKNNICIEPLLLEQGVFLKGYEAQRGWRWNSGSAPATTTGFLFDYDHGKLWQHPSASPSTSNTQHSKVTHLFSGDSKITQQALLLCLNEQLAAKRQNYFAAVIVLQGLSGLQTKKNYEDESLKETRGHADVCSEAIQVERGYGSKERQVFAMTCF